jgi:hypothetical protein
MISGQKLIEQYKLQYFELFNLIKSGLPAYSETGRKIVDIDTLPRTKKTLEEIESEIFKRLAGAKNAYMPDGPTSDNKETIETNIKELALAEFEQQRGWPICPPHCDMFDFTLPHDDEKAKKKLKEIKHFLFKLKDVANFLPYIDPEAKHPD